MQRPHDDVVPLHEPFETAIRGFNRQQVLAHIESLEGRISMVMADRESALTQATELSRIIDHLREESEVLTQLREATTKATNDAERMQRSPIFAANVRVQLIVQLAEEEAADIKARAESEASDLKARASKEVADLTRRADQEITARHKRATGEVEALIRGTTQQCQQREMESEQDMARREYEAKNRIQNREQQSIAALHTILKTISLQLTERVSSVEQKEAELAETCVRASQELAALEALRAEVTAQLSTTRHVLTEALG